MTFPENIGSRLRDEYGLEESFLASPGSLAAVQSRMRHTGVTDETAYYGQLQGSADEFAAFVDELLVPESWFFRDRAPFEFLARWVQDVWRTQGEGRTLRVLSVPCAAGPEPYSIAMTLLDAGLAQKSFRVYAGDVSEQNLEQARKAEYRKLAFRGQDATGRQHHFKPLDNGDFRVCEKVRGCVSFKQCNLLEGGSLAFAPSFDIIFCRNVLIYFTEAARKRVIDNIAELLSRDGLLFVGHADGIQLLTQAFQPVGNASAFCYRRREKAVAPEMKMGAQARPRAARRPLPKASLLSRTLPTRATRPSAASKQSTQPCYTLVEAQAMADRGELSEARETCLGHLQQGGPTADALLLLAQIELASSHVAEAEGSLRKALYLNPNHREALVQMALLAERRGADDEAKRLRQRARKQEAATHG